MTGCVWQLKESDMGAENFLRASAHLPHKPGLTS